METPEEQLERVAEPQNEETQVTSEESERVVEVVTTPTPDTRPPEERPDESDQVDGQADGEASDDAEA